MFSKIPVPARLLAFGALAVAPFLAACQPPAATFTVDTPFDSVDADIGDGLCETSTGTCSLRAAIQEGNANAAAGPIEVILPAGTFTVGAFGSGSGEDAAATGDLDLLRPFRLVGSQVPGETTRIFGLGGDRLVDAHPGGRLEMNDVQLSTGAVTGSGGLVRAVGADVTLTRVKLDGALATVGGLVSVDGGTLTVMDSALSNGEADAGGAISADRLVMARSSVTDSEAVEGAGIFLTDPAASSTIDASTVAGSTASSGSAVTAVGSLVVRDSAITDNHATDGSLAGGAAVQIANSIVSASTGDDCRDGLTSLGGNAASDATCSLPMPTDVNNAPLTASGYVPAGLGTAPFFDTPLVIDAGTGCLPLGAGGQARPADGDFDGVAECDRGPVESTLLPRTFEVTTPADAVDAVPGDGICRTAALQCTLRAAIQEANARPTADVIDLETGVTHVLSRAGAGEDAAATGDLDISGDLVIRSSADTGATIDANDIDRVFDVHAGDVRFDRLTITDGSEAGGGGGIRIAAGADVAVVRTTVFQNVGVGGGGGIRTAGDLTIDRSLLRSNASGSGRGGGLIVTSGGLARIVNSTFFGNNSQHGAAINVMRGGSADLTYATVANNTAGAALLADGSLSLQASIVANNAAGNCDAAVSSLGFNLDSGATCGLAAAGDASNTDPMLGGIASNGGNTASMMPAVGSPAINTAGVCLAPWDQRGQARFSDIACDKGAVER
jgi:CSLREA domain-containing protein